MNSGTQIKALIRNLSKEKNIDAQILLRNYMMERLLERISLSEYKYSFVLKGGMLIAALVGLDARSTLDMDATIRGFAVSKETVQVMFEKILAVPIDDGINMQIRNIEDIRDDAEYSGLRLSLGTVFDGIRQSLKIDITTGDAITPRAIRYGYKLMLESRSIEVMAYNLETILAEKLETIISRSTANTRMRDFYDIYMLTLTRMDEIDYALLWNALSATAKKRGTVVQLQQTDQTIFEVIKSKVMQEFWQRYQAQYNYAKDIAWEDVAKALLNVIEKVK